MNNPGRYEIRKELTALVPNLIRALRPSALLLLLLLFGLSASAQTSTTGSIEGMVVDVNGAAIPGITVSVSGPNLIRAQSATTNDEGYFQIPQLPPGRYTVIIEAAKGFARFEQADVEVNLNRTSIIAVILRPAGATETVEVTASSGAAVDVSTTTGTNVSTEQFSNFPTQRTIQSLYTIAPAISRSGLRDASDRDPSVGGSSGPEITYILDGVTISDPAFGGSSSVSVSESAIQEFQAANAVYSAEYGLGGGGGLMNAVTKTGTNTFHGTLFSSFGDDALHAKGAFGDTSKPSFGRQWFSGSAGGPLKRDKMFFFASVDRAREKGVTPAGVRDPARRVIAQTFARTTHFETQLTARLDATPNDSDQFVARYTLAKSDGVEPGFSQGGKLQDASNFQSLSDNQQQVMASWTRTINLSTLNEARFSYITSDTRTLPLTNAPQIVFPSINVGANFQADRHYLQRQFESRDDFSWARGSQNFKFGMNYQHISLPSPSNFNLFGTGLVFVACDFPGEAGCPKIHTEAEMPVIFSLINRQTLTDGLTDFGTRGNLSPVRDDRIGLYGQAGFNLTPKVRLTLGARWDYDNDFIGKKQTNRARPGSRKVGKKNIQPRLGIVWRLTRITIRGGHGLFFDQSPLETRQLELLADDTRLPIVKSFGGTLGAPFAGVGINSPTVIFVTSNELRLPYTFQTSAGVEHDLGHHSSISADFVSARGRRYPRRVEVNRRSDGSRADARFDNVIETQSIIKTAKDQLIVKFKTRPSPYSGLLERFTLDASYTLSRAYDEANDPLGYIESIGGASVSALERAPSPLDARHRFVVYGIFNLSRGVLISPIVSMRSSLPFEIIQNHDFSEGIGAGFFRLPTLGRNAGNRQVRTGADVNRAIDAFNANPALVVAHGGPLAQVSPDLTFSRPYFTFNLRLSKRFNLSESASLELGCDGFNLFNHTNVVGATATNSSGLENNVELRNFGRPTGVTPGGVFGPNAARAFQLFARFNF